MYAQGYAPGPGPDARVDVTVPLSPEAVPVKTTHGSPRPTGGKTSAQPPGESDIRLKR